MKFFRHAVITRKITGLKYPKKAPFLLLQHCYNKFIIFKWALVSLFFLNTREQAITIPIKMLMMTQVYETKNIFWFLVMTVKTVILNPFAAVRQHTSRVPWRDHCLVPWRDHCLVRRVQVWLLMLHPKGLVTGQKILCLHSGAGWKQQKPTCGGANVNTQGKHVKDMQLPSSPCDSC